MFYQYKTFDDDVNAQIERIVSHRSRTERPAFPPLNLSGREIAQKGQKSPKFKLQRIEFR
jgi:hypothetical protein